MSIEKLSIRAQSFAAACALEKHCFVSGIKHNALGEFCLHMKSLATAHNITSWDEAANQLEITGMGDGLPDVLSNITWLQEATECAREISAVNMFGAFQPIETQSNFKRAIDICESQLSLDVIQKFMGHSAGNSGWGVALSENEYNVWQKMLVGV